MTAVYALALTDRIVILTDAAHYNDAGILLAIAPKVWTCPLAPFAVTGHGSSDMVKEKADIMCRMASFEAALGYLELSIQVASLHPPETHKAMFPNGAGVLLAGHSETGFRQVYCSFDDLDPRFPPLTLTEIEQEYAATPTPTGENAVAFANLIGELADLGAEFFPKRGADLFELLRQEKTAMVGSDTAHHLVGGRVDLTIIDAAGATTTTLRTWPDVVGKVISPA